WLPPVASPGRPRTSTAHRARTGSAFTGGRVAFRWTRVVVLGAFSLTAAACKEVGNGPTAPCGLGNPCSGSGTLASLTLSPAFDTLLVGDEAQIVVNATSTSGNPVTIHSTFSSSNPHVATVDTTGLIR